MDERDGGNLLWQFVWTFCVGFYWRWETVEGGCGGIEEAVGIAQAQDLSGREIIKNDRERRMV